MTRREREAKWRDRVRKQKRGKLSVRDFCRRERVSEKSFYSWRRRFAGEGAPEREFVEVAAPHVAQAIEVVASDGTVVHVPAGFDAKTLERLLDVLDGRR